MTFSRSVNEKLPLNWIWVVQKPGQSCGLHFMFLKPFLNGICGLLRNIIWLDVGVQPLGVVRGDLLFMDCSIVKVDGTCQSNIHMNARTQSFPEHCNVMRCGHCYSLHLSVVSMLWLISVYLLRMGHDCQIAQKCLEMPKKMPRNTLDTPAIRPCTLLSLSRWRGTIKLTVS